MSTLCYRTSLSRRRLCIRVFRHPAVRQCPFCPPPPPSISTRFSDLSKLVLALGVSGDGGSGVWNVHLLGPIIRGVWCTPDIGVGCDCSGSCTCCGVYLIWLRGCGVSILRHLRTMAGVHTSTSHSGEAMTSGLRIPTGRCGVACGVCGIRQGVGGFSPSGGGGGFFLIAPDRCLPFQQLPLLFLVLLPGGHRYSPEKQW